MRSNRSLSLSKSRCVRPSLKTVPAASDSVNAEKITTAFFFCRYCLSNVFQNVPVRCRARSCITGARALLLCHGRGARRSRLHCASAYGLCGVTASIFDVKRDLPAIAREDAGHLRAHGSEACTGHGDVPGPTTYPHVLVYSCSAQPRVGAPTLLPARLTWAYDDGSKTLWLVILPVGAPTTCSCTRGRRCAAGSDHVVGATLARGILLAFTQPDRVTQ